MMAQSPSDQRVRRFYVSWVDPSRDPWPTENFGDAAAEIWAGDGLQDRPEADKLWPGVPAIGGRLCIGPTLLALFHTNSPYANLTDKDHVYLLHGENDSQVPQLKEALERIATARGAKTPEFKLVPLAGITEMTDQSQIGKALENWTKDYPFLTRDKVKTQIVVNLSAGTPIMQSCLSGLDWKEIARHVKGEEAKVEFIQERTGLRPHDLVDDECPKPLFVPLQMAVPQVTPQVTSRAGFDVRLEELDFPGYKTVREQIKQAAALGIPIVLHGERGTGKTSLAKYYHHLRQRQRAVMPPKQAANQQTLSDKSEIAGPREPDSEGGRGQFVPITLSEFRRLEDLRSELFGWTIGSFTGATSDYDGLLGEAHEGTLFLDEIHHLRKKLQAALLALLNDGTYRPKGKHRLRDQRL